MAYENFKPTVWSTKIQLEMPKFTVFENECNYQFEGEVKKGRSVKIIGVGRPTIGDYTGQSIGTPEVIPDTAILMPIDQAKYFNFMVDDVDAAQAIDGQMEALLEGSIRALAEERDKYIAKLCALESGACSASLAITDKASVKQAVDAALVKLMSEGVNLSSDNVTIFLSPKAFLYFADYVLDTRTQNDKALETGVLGRYMGCNVKMSNNFYNDGTDDYMIVKTDKAVAFASGLDQMEAYRPQNLFCDAVRGLNTFGGRVVRPKEMYIIKAHYEA